MRGRYETRTWQHDPALYAPARYRRACTYDLFLPERLADFAPSLDAATVGVVSDAERAMHQIGSDSSRALAPLARLLLRTESIASSKVEGLQADVRTVQNWIGGNDYNPCGADFVPPPAEHVEPLLADLCDAIADETLPPVVQAALVHAQFETIHPFDDGNGRTGRSLIHVVLRRRTLTPGYVPPISVVFARDRDRYIAGLTAYRNGAVDGWVEQFAAAASRAASLARAYLAAVERLSNRWRSLLGAASNPRSDAAAWAVIEVLPAHPVITAAVAQAATGRAKASVHAALDQLADAGVLLPLTGGRRNRSWEAAGLLDLIADLEAGEPPRRHTD